MSGRDSTQLAFDFLGQLGLLKRNGQLVTPKAFWGRLGNLRCRELVNIADEITEFFRLPNTNTILNAERSFSTHRASLLLGGSPIHSIESGCRLFEIEHLSRFALLYSDRVYINNFFGRYFMYLMQKILLKPVNAQKMVARRHFPLRKAKGIVAGREKL